MTTLRGAMRSYNAAVNRIEREHQRQNREAARRFKEQQKMQSILDAEQAVSDWEAYVDTIKSMHKDCSERVNWLKLNNQIKPSEPELSNRHERDAQLKLEAYKPSFFDKLLKLTDKRIDGLKRKVDLAKEVDRREYSDAQEKYLAELKEWEDMQSLSKGVIDKNPEFYLKALEFFQPLADISELGAKLSFEIKSNFIDIDLFVNTNEVIPNYVLSQTSTGKLSKKDMPKARFFELYQDHVCSAILRVAREIFALLPVDYARINAISNMLNTQTGFMEDKPIVSVIIMPETLNKLNMDSLDPSDSMNNFIHAMKFKKSTGFEPVEKASLPKAE